MRCLTSARFTMSALLLRPETGTPQNPSEGTSPNGNYEYQQDPDSGGLIPVWVPAQDDVEENETAVNAGLLPGRRFKCQVRGFTDGGIRVAGTTERFSSRGTIETVDFVTIKFPKNIVITRRDRITDIRNARNELLWKEEEYDDSATIFEVNGVTPILGPSNQFIEQSALLQRAEIQSGS